MGPGPSSSLLSLKKERICLLLKPTSLNRLFQQTDDLPSCVPPFSQTITRWYRNINLFSIAYAFRPRLRDRLTLSRLALLRKPWAIGEGVSHPLYRYSCQHGLLCKLHMTSRPRFNTYTMLSYQRNKFLSAASVLCLSPVTFSAQNHSISELLRFL